MVVRVWRQVTKALPEDRVWVATDDDRIRDECERHGIQTVMTSEGCLTGTDRVYEAATKIDAEIIVNVQGDEPLVDPEHIRRVLEAKRSHPDAVVNAMAPIEEQQDVESRHVPKVVVDGEGSLVYMSRAPIPFHKDDEAGERYLHQVCIYAFSPEHLRKFGQCESKTTLERPEDIEILRFLDLGIPVQMVEVQGDSVAVDVPEDVPRAEAALGSDGEQDGSRSG